MKRLFFAALIALFSIAASRAQNAGQRSAAAADSLTNSCWRNEQTGDWEIAFFEDCAVYRCKFWTYKRREVNPKTGEAKLVLANGNEELAVSVGKYKRGKRPLRIGKQKILCSRLTGKVLPDYPIEDTRTDFVNNGYRMDTVTVSGWIRNIPEEHAGDKTLQVVDWDFFTTEESSVSANLDPQGRFTVRVPILNTTSVLFRGAGYYAFTILEPGKNYFIFFDHDGQRHYFMGDDVRLQNEVYAHNNAFQWQPVREESLDDVDRYAASVDSALKVFDAKVDSVCRRHSLSERYRAYVLGGALWSQASIFGQTCFFSVSPQLLGKARRHAGDVFWPRITEPVTLHPEIRLFLTDYLREEIERGKFHFELDVMEHLAEIASDDRELDILTRFRKFVDESKAKLEAAATEEEKQRIIAETSAIHKELWPEVDKILNGLRAQAVFEEHLTVAELPFFAHRLDSIRAVPVIKDAFLCEFVYGRIDHASRCVSSRVIDTLKAYVGNPIGIERVERKNEYYRALANREFDKLVLKSSDNLQGISEGEELLSKLLEPFKGKLVLLDVWGTWCGPCKQALSHSAEEYARLNKYDVAYLYLANGSPTEAWENVIKQYNVSGENVAHYNLPAEQQKAIERYLNVSSFPTYKLFDREGRLLDIKVDARDLDKLENIIRQLSGQ